MQLLSNSYPREERLSHMIKLRLGRGGAGMLENGFPLLKNQEATNKAIRGSRIRCTMSVEREKPRMDWGRNDLTRRFFAKECCRSEGLSF